MALPIGIGLIVRPMLYVPLTRAMPALVLTHRGEISSLLKSFHPAELQNVD